MKTNKQINGTIRCMCVCTVHILHTHTSTTSFYVLCFVFSLSFRCLCMFMCAMYLPVRVVVSRNEQKSSEKWQWRKMLPTKSSKTSRIEKGQTIKHANIIKYEIFFMLLIFFLVRGEKRSEGIEAKGWNEIEEGNYGTSLEDSKISWMTWKENKTFTRDVNKMHILCVSERVRACEHCSSPPFSLSESESSVGQQLKTKSK